VIRAIGLENGPIRRDGRKLPSARERCRIVQLHFGQVMPGQRGVDGRNGH
jgi:hypothetical protein